MNPIPFDNAAGELLEVIRSRSAALVIGAGASIPCGAPSSATLVEELREKFPLADIPPGADFLKAGTAICDTPPYGRLTLVDYLKTRFGTLEPDHSYKQLPRWHWRAIFTTNYDDLIEQAYRTPSRVQTLRPTHLPYDLATIPREQHLYLFYLQGSITQPADSDASPVVSWGDFMRTVQDRISVMNLFKGILVDDGKVIYVGYSFEDFFLDGVLTEATRRLGHTHLPYGYAIIPDWPDNPTKRHKITKHNIIPVNGTFEDFAMLVSQAAEHGYQTRLDFEKHAAPAAGYDVRVGDEVVTLSESEAAVYSEYFDLLYDSEVEVRALNHEQQRALARAFLKGDQLGWLPFRRQWAFKRETYKDLLDHIRELLERTAKIKDRFVLVHGPAGLGKSVMARQLAFDLYTSTHTPVLLAKSTWRTRPDFKLIDRFFDDLESKLSGNASPPGVVLVIDEGELIDRTLPARVVRYLQSRGRELLVVVFARTNEYFRAARYGEEHLPSSWGTPITYELNDTLTDSEITALVEHVVELNVWNNDRVRHASFWVDYIKEHYASYFFDAVYALVEETQTPLRERVRSEYDNLSQVAQRAYQLIAAVHQFGIMLKLEVLTRALKIDWPTFDEEIIRGDARSVLFAQHVTSDLNVNFRGRTKLISGLVFEHAVPDHHDQLSIFKQIISAFNPNDMFGIDELDSLRTLLVQVFGPGGFDNRFSNQEVAELFAVASEVIEDDVIEHHYGLIERDCGRLLSAREHLEKALSLTAILPADLAIQRESPQNIENSLAQVIGDLALEALARGSEASADSLVEEASTHFYNARNGHFPNAAAYDAHARLLLKRARRLYKDGSKERAIAFSEALDVLSVGIDNVNDEHRPDLVALRSEVLTELGQQSEAIGDLARKAEHGSPQERARYHLILARIVAFSEGKLAKRKLIRRAFTHTVDACELAPEYFDAQKMRAELFKELYPEDIEGLHRLLVEVGRCDGARDNYWYWYELGVCSFYLRNYHESATSFSSLRQISRGSSRSVGVIEVAGTRTGDSPFEFEGRVIRRGPTRWGIDSPDLEAFGPLYFNPRAERYYTPRDRDRVTFEVAFNYRGPIGIELRRQ